MWIRALVLASTLGACAQSHARDAGAVDGGIPSEDAEGCGCLTSERRVTGPADRPFEHELRVEQCAGALRCQVDGIDRSCFLTGEPALRVHLDEVGYAQLLFAIPGCRPVWWGSYFAEGEAFAVSAVETR